MSRRLRSGRDLCPIIASPHKGQGWGCGARKLSEAMDGIVRG